VVKEEDEAGSWPRRTIARSAAMAKEEDDTRSASMA
jgi:hypothetical protein